MLLRRPSISLFPKTEAPASLDWLSRDGDLAVSRRRVRALQTVTTSVGARIAPDLCRASRSRLVLLSCPSLRGARPKRGIIGFELDHRPDDKAHRRKCDEQVRRLANRRCRQSPRSLLWFETRSLPALTRFYPRQFSLITRTALCSRELPWLRFRLPARFPKAACSMSRVPHAQLTRTRHADFLPRSALRCDTDPGTHLLTCRLLRSADRTVLLGRFSPAGPTSD